MNQLPQKISLVAQTVAVLEQEVHSGRWVGLLPGEHELCTQLHVSRRTVREALDQLSRKGLVRCHRGKRRQIVGVQAPRHRPSGHRVVVLMPMPLQSFDPSAVFLIDRLREHLAQEGYLLETHASRVPFRARLPQELKNLEATLHPAAWVLLHSTEQMQRWFAQGRRPCVIVGSCYPGVDLASVDTDYGALCRHAVGLFTARGHRRLALLNPLPAAAGDTETAAFFRQAAALANLEGANVVQHDGTVESVCARVNGLLRLARPPLALLVSRPRHVLTVLGHLARRGARLPQDVALISRDDDSFLKDVVPSVARYSRNPSLLASKVSRAVLDMVHGASRPADHKLMPNFIPGETLG